MNVGLPCCLGILPTDSRSLTPYSSRMRVLGSRSVTHPRARTHFARLTNMAIPSSEGIHRARGCRGIQCWKHSREKHVRPREGYGLFLTRYRRGSGGKPSGSNQYRDRVNAEMWRCLGIQCSDWIPNEGRETDIYRLISATLCGWLLLTGGVLAAEERTVYTQSANGTRNTRPFTVQDRWELRWSAKGEKLAIFLYTADGEPRGFLPIVTQDKPGGDRSYYPKGGEYYLKVLTEGDWTVTIVQLP
jgi:hypothetical protein